MKQIEHRLQCSCVTWFRLQYPRLVLFAIPNGGARSITTGAMLKAEGVLTGVADLFLMFPVKLFHGLFIEMKTDKGRQSESQKKFQMLAESNGYKYVVCRSFEDFKNEILTYLKQ